MASQRREGEKNNKYVQKISPPVYGV
ncbi:MAG: hypothetical protein RLZZ196_2009, partial [Bacteroidota bacterium]